MYFNPYLKALSLSVYTLTVYIRYCILLNKPNPFLFPFSCIKNCQERVNPDEKLIVESTCTANCYGQLEFQWTLFWFDNIDTPEPFDLSELNKV